MLFFDFMLTNAQDLMLKRDFIPTGKRISTPLNRFPLTFVDPKVVLDENDKWTKHYRDVIGIKRKWPQKRG